jgi:acyl carrier protein
MCNDVDHRSAGDPDLVLASIREFLKTSSGLTGADDVTLETPLLEGGGLDSLTILQLVTFLNDSMKIEVNDEDFVPENFKNVGSLVRFVLGKR